MILEGLDRRGSWSIPRAPIGGLRTDATCSENTITIALCRSTPFFLLQLFPFGVGEKNVEREVHNSEVESNDFRSGQFYKQITRSNKQRGVERYASFYGGGWHFFGLDLVKIGVEKELNGLTWEFLHLGLHGGVILSQIKLWLDGIGWRWYLHRGCLPNLEIISRNTWFFSLDLSSSGSFSFFVQEFVGLFRDRTERKRSDFDIYR